LAEFPNKSPNTPKFHHLEVRTNHTFEKPPATPPKGPQKSQLARWPIEC